MAVRTRKDRGGDHVAYSEIAIRNNGSIIEYCRTSMAALSGSTAGLLGFTALTGFIFYFVTAFVLWLMLLWKAGSKWKNYFMNRRTLLTNGLFGGLFTYVLFWTYPFISLALKAEN